MRACWLRTRTLRRTTATASEMADNPWGPDGIYDPRWSGNRWDFPVLTPNEVGTLVWSNFSIVSKSGEEAYYREQAAETWGVECQRWRLPLSATMKTYTPLYGYIHQSARKHGMSAEFLQAVVMGENLNAFLEMQDSNGNRFDNSMIVDAYSYLGLDDLRDDLPALISRGYLDGGIRKYVYLNTTVATTNELGEDKYSGNIQGYDHCIEIVAAELHSRLDYMMLLAEAYAVSVTTPQQREFLMYAKYVSRNQAEADFYSDASFAEQMRKWDVSVDGAKPTDPHDPRYYRYQTLLRLCTAEWFKLAGVYTETLT